MQRHHRNHWRICTATYTVHISTLDILRKNEIGLYDNCVDNRIGLYNYIKQHWIMSGVHGSSKWHRSTLYISSSNRHRTTVHRADIPPRKSVKQLTHAKHSFYVLLGSGAELAWAYSRLSTCSQSGAVDRRWESSTPPPYQFSIVSLQLVQ